MMAQSAFKEQLLEFVEGREEPFNLDFLVKSCNETFIDENRFQNALYELEEEGQIIRLDDHYLSTRVLMRRWIKTETPAHEKGLSLPQSLIRHIQGLLEERPELGYVDVDEFVRDAIRRFIQHHQAK